MCGLYPDGVEALMPEQLGTQWFLLSDFKSRFEVQATFQIYENKPGDVSLALSHRNLI